MAHIDRLFHLAELPNLASILRHGLFSTRALLAHIGLGEAERQVLLRRHRPECVELPGGLMIRDQKPMPPKALSQALAPGLAPEDWYELLNGFVFLWPDRKRLERQRGACGMRPQAVLVFDGDTLLRDFGAQARVSPINSGNARRRPAHRGLETFVAYDTWQRHGWPAVGGRPRQGPPAEVVFSCPVPARAPYLLAVEPATNLSQAENGNVYERGGVD